MFLISQAAADALKAESVTGLATISSFPKVSDYFKKRCVTMSIPLMDKIGLTQYNRYWYQFRVSMINLLVSIGIIAAALLSSSRSTIFSALVALALTQAETCSTQLIELVGFIAQNKSQVIVVNHR